MVLFDAFTFLLATHSLLGPPQEILDAVFPTINAYFDIQAHRGGRGSAVENTLPSFAWGMIDGATTLELDNGITKDGVVVVWHDEMIESRKCRDTVPAFPNDPDFPYVGKYIADLTFVQLRTLDCGALRQTMYPNQLTYPGTRISSLRELFDFVKCADPNRRILWNIESKIDAPNPNRTKSPEEFVKGQYKIFANSGYKNSITYQSFDWRTLALMKDLDPEITTSALICDETAFNLSDPTAASSWHAGLNISSFPGLTVGEKVAQAAHALRADILSPSFESQLGSPPDPAVGGFKLFTSKEMVDEAHRLGLKVKIWTVNNLNAVEQAVGWKVDGIITDYSHAVRRWFQQQSLPVAPEFPKRRVLSCLNKHLALQHGDSQSS